jgi:hypothetical protein
MLWAGLAFYARSTTGKDRIGWSGLLVIGVVLTIMGAGAYLGPPPPSVLPLAVLNVVLVLPLLLMDWIDRHRRIVA